MARTPKAGLDYFPLDVDFLQDTNIRKLRRLHGPLGLVVYINLLCRVYKSGYYIKFDDIEELAFDIAEEITSDKMSRDSSKIAQVILDIGILGLVDKAYLEKGVITSDSIKRQYIEVLKKSKRKVPENKDYKSDEKPNNSEIISLNMEENNIHTEEKPITSEEIAITSEDMQQNKLNENKLNEIINNNTLLSKNDNVYVSRFELFWKEYPRKEGKKKCLDWFKRNKPTEELFNKMLEAISKQRRTDKWIKDKGRFIPMPFTWLNQGRWDDEVLDEIDVSNGKKKGGYLKNEEYV